MFRHIPENQTASPRTPPLLKKLYFKTYLSPSETMFTRPKLPIPPLQELSCATEALSVPRLHSIIKRLQEANKYSDPPRTENGRRRDYRVLRERSRRVAALLREEASNAESPELEVNAEIPYENSPKVESAERVINTTEPPREVCLNDLDQTAKGPAQVDAFALLQDEGKPENLPTPPTDEGRQNDERELDIREEAAIQTSERSAVTAVSRGGALSNSQEHRPSEHAEDISAFNPNIHEQQQTRRRGVKRRRLEVARAYWLRSNQPGASSKRSRRTKYWLRP